MPPELSGFVGTFHPAAPGSSPQLFSIYTVQIVYLSLGLECEKTKIKKKRLGLAHFLKLFQLKWLILLTNMGGRHHDLVVMGEGSQSVGCG